MDSQSSVPDDGGELARILSICRAYKTSKALNLSCKLGLYTLLEQPQDKPLIDDRISGDDGEHRRSGLTWREIAMRMGWRTHEGFRGAMDFLDLLVSIRMLERLGEGPDAR